MNTIDTFCSWKTMNLCNLNVITRKQSRNEKNKGQKINFTAISS